MKPENLIDRLARPYNPTTESERNIPGRVILRNDDPCGWGLDDDPDYFDEHPWQSWRITTAPARAIHEAGTEVAAMDSRRDCVAVKLSRNLGPGMHVGFVVFLLQHSRVAWLNGLDHDGLWSVYKSIIRQQSEPQFSRYPRSGEAWL